MHFPTQVQRVRVALLSPSGRSERDLMLPVGKFCGFGSAVPVLIIPCVSLAIFARSETPSCMFGVLACQLGSICRV